MKIGDDYARFMLGGLKDLKLDGRLFGEMSRRAMRQF
jgi:hypothetical protein